MLEYIEQAAHYLEMHGVDAGQRVGLCTENRLPAAITVLACWKVGAVAMPISTRLPPAGIPRLLDEMGCAALLDFHGPAAPACSVPRLDLGDIATVRSRRLSGVHLEELGANLEQHASIVLTSGSTGRPKGVLHTIGNHYHSALGSQQHIPFTEGDGWLVSIPLYHIGGLSLLMRALLRGGTLVFPQEGQSLEQTLAGPQVTHVSLVPTQLKRFLADPYIVTALQRKKAILVGGAPCPTSLVEACAKRKLPIYLTYGSSEMGSQIATSTPAMAYTHPRSSGRVLPYREIRIAADGEILARGETLFVGYVVAGRIEPAVDDDGWFHTGDVGHYDEAGNLAVTGRKDSLFISGGENIYPEEVETVLMGLRGVQQCVVVSVDDDEFGQRPVAFVKADTLDADSIKAELARSLERFKVPDQIYAWPSAYPVPSKVDRPHFTRLAGELRRDGNGR